ncbi:MAG: hypothetical protein ABW171_00110, partial [Steroidobacter sp.]
MIHMPACNLLKIAVPLALALSLIACSDSESPPEGVERTVAAPLPDVTTLANASGTKPPPIPAPPQVQARGYVLLDYTSN